MKKPIQISELLWEYEDQLPPMRSDDYETLYQYSKVIEGVRMYPFIEDAVGNKIWIAIRTHNHNEQHEQNTSRKTRARLCLFKLLPSTNNWRWI